MRLKKILICAAAVCCTALSGCGFGSSVDSLLLPPMMSEEQEKIYSALEEAVGSDITLVYPRSGAYRSAFVFYDLDGDGTNEAVVFYDNKDDSESNVRVNIIEDDGGEWRSVYDHAGAGSSVEQVFFTDLGGQGKVSMAIGYGYMTPTEKTLRIYSYAHEILSMDYAEIYYKTLTIDLDRDGGEDIAIINCNNENHSAYLSLVSDKGNGAECVGTVAMSENTADIPSVIGGYIGQNTPAIFADGLMGSGNLSTEIIYCVNGQLRNPADLTGSDIRALTTRASGLYCTDIDGDGIIEIPSREPFPGYRENSEMQYITNWNVFENYTIVKKYSSLTSAAQDYCFMLPVRWEGLVTVKNDSVTGEKVFYKYNTSLSESRLELMRILACSPSAVQSRLEEGYITVFGGEEQSADPAGAVHMVRFGDTEDNLLLTEAEVKNNFYKY